MKNITASVQEKLKNIAKKENKNFDLILLLYLQERILFRLSKSKYKDHFVLKGGLFLYTISQSYSRPTKDIDLLGKQIKNDINNVSDAFKDICNLSIDEEDGVVFDENTIKAIKIKEDADYEGVRITLIGFLGKMKKTLQMDIGFGDVVVPKVNEILYPTLLKSESPVISVYSLESVIAEKFEAMISLSVMNSRLKDFYDIHMLMETNEFDGRKLLEAINETFNRRKTNIKKDHEIFLDEFLNEEKRHQQWNAFLKRTDLEAESFPKIMGDITIFLKPIYDKMLKEEEFFGYWDNENLQWKKSSNSAIANSDL